MRQGQVQHFPIAADFTAQLGFEIEESQAGPPRGEFDEQALKLGVRDGKNHDVTPREPTKKIEQAAGVRPALPAGGA